MGAFNWNPGGCCCEIFTDIMAFGVDNLDNPTKTRIPRTCNITYDNILWRDGFGNPTPPPPCSVGTYLDNYTHHLKAWAPYYAVQKPPQANAPQQMCWTTALEQYVIRPAWPGLVAGRPDFTKGRLPRRIRTVFDQTQVNQADPDPPFPVDAGGGVLGSNQNFHSLASNIVGQPNFAYPYYTPAPTFMIAGSCTPDDDIPNIAELVLRAGPTTTGQAVASFGSFFGGVTDTFGADIPIWNKDIGPTQQRTFQLSGGVTRTQWICVIPNTITFAQADYFRPGGQFARNRWGWLYPMNITVTFGDWFEGPIANAP